ncbi:lysozyme inhibitor LprI family protein [Roseovarius sp. 2305UL8-3]|uniref:lysozyme inhibitor LprI family protein n=1 Tax=Roseovarius conchicola TaxID=3121636 RepID=UPI003527B4CB
MRIVLCLLMIPTALSAQEIDFDITPTASCVASDRGAECIGIAANLCMERNEGGFSTNGMAICTDRELEWWDDRLNLIYKDTKARLQRFDDEKPDYAPSQVEALKDMQRAWIPFRDAKCEFVAAGWGGGSGAGPATLWCLMEETARQTLYLEQSFQE